MIWRAAHVGEAPLECGGSALSIELHGAGWLLLGCLVLALSFAPARADDPKPLRIGIIGCDTSHVPAFTQEFNRPDAPDELRGLRVVAAYPGGSPDVASSRDRVEGFTEQLRGQGIEIVDSIESLLAKCDAVLLESVDGRPHLAQARLVFQAKKPIFIDKPAAGSLADVIAIYRLAEEHGIPCFSSSSLRFSPGILGMRSNDQVGSVLGVDAWSPCSLEEHHPDLFWYGVHGVEILFTIMGTGCESVTRVQTEGCELVVGRWRDGRVGTFRGLRAGTTGYGATVFGAKGIAQAGPYEGYKPLVLEIGKFFRTGQPPVSAEETIEMFAFMEAADESKRQGGVPVKLDEVLAKARLEAAAKLTGGK